MHQYFSILRSTPHNFSRHFRIIIKILFSHLFEQYYSSYTNSYGLLIYIKDLTKIYKQLIKIVFVNNNCLYFILYDFYFQLQQLQSTLHSFMEKQSDIIRKAQQLHINEQYTQSNQSLSIISQSNNPKFNIYKLKARNYLELHQLQNAKLNAYETIKRAPNKPDGYLIKARIYLMMGKYEESLPILEKAFINDQKCIEYFYLKAYALTKLGKYGESKQYYEKCFIRQTDYNPLTFIGKAELLILTNQVDQAKKCIQYAKKATRQQSFQKTVSRSDRRRLKRCLQAYNQIMQMIKKVQEAGTKYYKKISKQKRIIQKDYIKNMNEAIFLKNIDIIEAMTKKYKKLLNNEYSIDDISEAQTTDSTSIFSCCFSKQQHTC